ncbi:MAG TPA: thioredoxin domain-containing protein [Candidatus Bathyarchaeia archaeon]|jgi:thioredoxin 1|nr:thioredoxin domain-containing protein [Candidatus Bathyarchaeia archaeon]
MENVAEVNVNNWQQEVSKSSILTVIYFWHNQCHWCFRLTPIIDKVSHEFSGKVKFVKLNILEDQTNQEIANNYGVMSTPTLMFFCSGRPAGQIVGFMSEEDLKRLLNDMLGKYRTCLLQSTELRAYIV